MKFALSFLLISAANARATDSFSISNTIGSAMVLQRDTPLNSLWGFGPPGAVVSTQLTCSGCPSVPAATVGPDGVWRAVVPPLSATATPFNVSFSTAGFAALVLNDVLVGDVLLCAGRALPPRFAQRLFPRPSR